MLATNHSLNLGPNQQAYTVVQRLFCHELSSKSVHNFGVIPRTHSYINRRKKFVSFTEVITRIFGRYFLVLAVFS